MLFLLKVIINIEKDNGPPEFQNLPYSTRIDHDQQVNSLVQVTSAIDRDLKGELIYEIVGDPPATSFFSLANDKSGRIVLRNDLRADSLETER